MLESLDRGLAVLELVADRGEIRLAEVARILGVSRATAHRVLSALQDRRFVEHRGDEHVYTLGSAVVSLAAKAATASVTALARPAMADLHARTGETINLALLVRGRIIWVATVDAVHAIRLHNTIGEHVPPHATATGKAILATLPPNQQTSMLGPEPYRRFTEGTRTSLAELREDLAHVKTDGYAVDNGEMEVGGVCVAAPILAPDNRPLGAISISAIKARFEGATRDQAGRAVRSWCRRITATLRSSATPASPGGPAAHPG